MHNDLTKLKELAERATPGPWSAVWEEGDDTAWQNLFPIMLAKDRPSPNEWCGDTIREDVLDAAIDAALEGGGR